MEAGNYMPYTGKQLQDTDAMPYGKKHKGIPMSEVPASYLFWLWTECGFESNFTEPVADYIRRNRDSLKKKYRDGIW